MVYVSSWYSLSSPSPIRDFTSLLDKKGITICGKQRLVCCSSGGHDQIQRVHRVEEEVKCETTHCHRREAMLQMVFTAFSFPLVVSDAVADNAADVAVDFRIYSDDTNKFKISIPKDWKAGVAEANGFKSITAFYPAEEASSSNVSVAITGIGADFTRMESFGKVDEFAESLVSGLDRSWKRPPGVAAKLIDCKSSKGLYYIEYSLKNPGDSLRHIYSAIGMASNGYYNRLYTVTGQFVEEEEAKYSSKIQKTVASFRFI